MALTRAYKETVVARIKRDHEFARALFAEAVGALLEGETAEGLSMLRNWCTPKSRSRNWRGRPASAKKRCTGC